MTPEDRTIHSTGLNTNMAVVLESPSPAGAAAADNLHGVRAGSFQRPPRMEAQGRRTRVHGAEGDGTVPGPSANPLTPNVAVSGVEHSAACSNVNVQRRIRKWIEELLSSRHHDRPASAAGGAPASGRARWPAARWGVSCPRI